MVQDIIQARILDDTHRLVQLTPTPRYDKDLGQGAVVIDPHDIAVQE